MVHYNYTPLHYWGHFLQRTQLHSTTLNYTYTMVTLVLHYTTLHLVARTLHMTLRRATKHPVQRNNCFDTPQIDR